MAYTPEGGDSGGFCRGDAVIAFGVLLIVSWLVGYGYSDESDSGEYGIRWLEFMPLTLFDEKLFWIVLGPGWWLNLVL